MLKIVEKVLLFRIYCVYLLALCIKQGAGRTINNPFKTR